MLWKKNKEDDKDTTKKTENNLTLNNCLSSICFYVTPDKHIKIACQWNDTEQASAKDFAQLLFQINSGLLVNHISTNLLDIASTNTENRSFIETVLIHWGLLSTSMLNQINTEQNTNQVSVDVTPLIKPSEVFNKQKNA
jgi:hypothetical protein